MPRKSGFVSSREIPVLWAITKGSLLNKLMILPLAFLLSAFAPWVVTLSLCLVLFISPMKVLKKIMNT
jgi:predicted DNA repair protein MutK